MQRGAAMPWRCFGTAEQFPNARVIDPLEVFCRPDRCLPSGHGGVFYGDSNHLTALGNELLYRRFESSFRWVYGSDD